MKNQTIFILGLTFLLGSASCIKDHHKPSSTVTVSTFAGGNVNGSADGMGISASFAGPSGIAVDVAGNVYVADHDYGLIRKISPAAVVTTLAGNDKVDMDGRGTTFWNPVGIAVDASGCIYVAYSRYNRIRKITQAGVVTTFAGTGIRGKADGSGTTATFNQPAGLALDPFGYIYVADDGNDNIRKVSPDGVVTTFVDSGNVGTAIRDVVLDAAGNVYVADADANVIRKITSKGVVSTLAGSGIPGAADGRGTAASFNRPFGLGIDDNGNIYVADRNNNKIRKVTPQGVVTTVAGSGEFGSNNGPGASATFTGPADISVDRFGHIYVTDGNKIRLILIK